MSSSYIIIKLPMTETEWLFLYSAVCKCEVGFDVLYVGLHK